MEDHTQEDSVLSTEELQQKLDDAMSGWKRTAADFENYKRRTEAQQKELIEFAREVAVVKLLPTLDSIEQALRHLPEIDDEQLRQWKTGIESLLKQLDKALAEMGVKKIEAVGKKFDPHFHEAIREVEGDEDGIIKEELQSGFELNGKVIRPSQVTITKKT